MSDSVLIIGGGVSGLAAAVACSSAGVRAIIVEHSAIVGGKLAAPLVDGLDGAYLGGERPMPDLEAIRTLACDPGKADADADGADAEATGVEGAGAGGIEIFTLSDLESLEGDAGAFTATLLERARFVTDACTRCNNCPTVCPQVTGNEFDAGLTYRKAIHTPLAQTLPDPFVVDIDSCLNIPPNYLPCQRCVDVCDDNAIDFSMPLASRHQRSVAAVIIAAGFEEADRNNLQEFGYGVYPDVVTSMELQRLLQSPGPTGGFVAKPTNEEYPESMLLVLQDNAPYAAYILGNQMERLADQDIKRASLLVLAQRGTGAELQSLEVIAADAGIPLCRGSWVGIREVDEGRLRVGMVDLATGLAREEDFDMVVLSSDVRPPVGLPELAAALDVRLADSGYIRCLSGDTLAAEGEGGAEDEENAEKRWSLATQTSRPGVYAAGCATGPKSVARCLAQARAAVTAAIGQFRCQSTAFAKGAVEAKKASQPLTEAEHRLRIERVLEALIRLGEG